MENTKAKKVIILVLVILLLVSFGVIIWQYLNINKQNLPTNTVTGNNAGQTTTNTQTENENDQNQKDEQIKVETVIKNEYVQFDGNKVKLDGKYINDTCTLYQISVLDFDENLEPKYYTLKINENGGVTAVYGGKTYTVKGFSKKVVELYAMSDLDTAVEGGIAIMEDGTIEQIYFDGSNFKTRGTISDVKDVVRLIYINHNGQRRAAAVQANGDTVVLFGLKNYYNPGA